MTYFTKEFIGYFRRLSRNNKREWFHAHNTEYEQHVKSPFNDFVAEIIDRMSLLDPEIDIQPKDAVFRIARDTRFSKDKTPYKTWMAAVVSRDGRRDHQYPGIYFHFSHKGIAVGGGMYQPDKQNLLKIRRAVLREGKTLARALQGKQFKATFGELQGAKNVRLPKEFAGAVERYPFIANKQFYYFAEYDDPKLLLKDDLPDFIVRHYKAGAKVSDFLRAAIA